MKVSFLTNKWIWVYNFIYRDGLFSECFFGDDRMCKIVSIDIGGKKVNIADIKVDYILNIADAASKCSYIDKVVLFGSSIEDRCTDQSDIDIAVFGNVSKNRCLTSKKYKEFTSQLYRYNDHAQAYDILYFSTNQLKDNFIMEEINKGEVIYEKQ